MTTTIIATQPLAQPSGVGQRVTLTEGQKAIGKLKVAGTFVAGGLASAVVMSGLMHGWPTGTGHAGQQSNKAIHGVAGNKAGVGVRPVQGSGIQVVYLQGAPATAARPGFPSPTKPAAGNPRKQRPPANARQMPSHWPRTATTHASAKQHVPSNWISQLMPGKPAPQARLSGIVDVPEWRGKRPNNYAISTDVASAQHILEGVRLGYVKDLSLGGQLGWKDV